MLCWQVHTAAHAVFFVFLQCLCSSNQLPLLRTPSSLQNGIGQICWVFEANSEAATTHFETNELLLGLSDARLPHWQQVVSATQFTHPQALLFTDIQACVQARLQAVRAQRAELSSALAGAAAGPTAPGAAAAAGDTGPGAATAAAAAAASREADLLAALEANVAGEAALIQASSFAIIAALTPGQFMSGFCASWCALVA
jgi:hypothetical protein